MHRLKCVCVCVTVLQICIMYNKHKKNDDWERGICQNLLFASNFEKTCFAELTLGSGLMVFPPFQWCSITVYLKTKIFIKFVSTHAFAYTH